MARSELELATSWSRAFQLIYTEVRWLAKFSQLNRIAVQKSIQKMQKSMLDIPDNVIEKKLMLLALTQWGPTFMPQK
jgi:hypothetical protein